MDYAALSTKVTELLADLGMAVTISRLDTVIAKTTGCFVADEETNDKQGKMSMVNTETRTMLIPGTIKKRPLAGDDVSCKIGSFKIIKVEQTNPAGSVILYKIRMT